jgi:type VI secretion system protein ImpL
VVTLRFAKDSPDIPVAGAGGVNTRTEGRTVSYEFRDPWALFRLIEEYGGKNADYGTSDNASTLRFVIPTASDPAHAKAQGTLKPQRETRVFARLRFYLAGGKEPRETPIPAFPASAPLIPGLPALNASN